MKVVHVPCHGKVQFMGENCATDNPHTVEVTMFYNDITAVD